MKKVVALLMILAVTSSTVFAAPVSAITGHQSGGSQDALSREVTRNNFDDLFNDVQATPLTNVEASEVEGEGFWGALIGGIIGGVGATCLVIGDILNNPPKTVSEIGGTAVIGVIGVGTSTLAGVGLGLALPF
ncbi:MAG: hypothetical protein LBP80_01875 [Treponema sp.]|jgi:hypothetical protein|nr:hypothetical protein [Treponema sp.]